MLTNRARGTNLRRGFRVNLGMNKLLFALCIAVTVTACAWDKHGDPKPYTTPNDTVKAVDSTAFYACGDSPYDAYTITGVTKNANLNALNNHASWGSWIVPYAAQVAYRNIAGQLSATYWREVSRDTYLWGWRHITQQNNCPYPASRMKP